jgi:hypothetical protein
MTLTLTDKIKDCIIGVLLTGDINLRNVLREVEHHLIGTRDVSDASKIDAEWVKSMEETIAFLKEASAHSPEITNVAFLEGNVEPEFVLYDVPVLDVEKLKSFLRPGIVVVSQSY